MNKWYAQMGENIDIVLSTRVRLARNLEEYPFPSHLDVESKNEVNEKIKNIIFDNDEYNFSFFQMSDITRIQAVSLAEKHIISPEFATGKKGTALIISQDESVSLMLNEEDHIRLQVMKSGLALGEAFEIADKIDSSIDEEIEYAFDQRLGYLTSSPINLGTALRASVFIHLPALTSCGQINSVINTISKLGLNVAPVYGNRSNNVGDIYQISNSITLGMNEETAISNLKSIVLQLVNQERNAAQREIKKPAVEDRIFRALGILKSARLINCTEFMKLISLVRFGVSAKLIENITIEHINALISEMQPATICASYEDVDTMEAQDAIRAKTVREILR